MTTRYFSGMIRWILPFILILFFSTKGFPGKDDYARQWKKADSLERAGLPRSALDIVQSIYQQSKKELNDPQYIKSIIYTLKLRAEFEEDNLEESIRFLSAEIPGAHQPVRSILQSLKGELLWSYYQRNSYRFRDRTSLSGVEGDSIRTWSLNRLALQITREYLGSVADAALLEQVPVSAWAAILESSDKDLKKDPPPDPTLRPTLYDLLIQRALDYFTSVNSLQTSLPADFFQADKRVYLDQPESFTALDFYTADSSSNIYFALKLYQAASIFHFPDKDPKVLIDFELSRMDYAYNHASFAAKDSLYQVALEKFSASYAYSPASASIRYALAQFLFEQGSKYQPGEGETYRWLKVRAKEICEKTMKQYPGEPGSKNCQALLNQILEANVDITTLYSVYPRKSFLLSLGFKNAKTAYFRIVKMDPDEYPKMTSRETRENLLRYFSSLPSVKSWQSTLPLAQDYQSHRVEMAGPGLEPGFYVLLSSPDKEFRTSAGGFSWSPLWASSISYVKQSRLDGGTDVYLLDRETGTPLAGAAIEAFSSNFNYRTREYETLQVGSYTSDGEGYFSLPPVSDNEHANNIVLKIKYKDDFLTSEGLYRYPRPESASKPVLQTRFFTDRAIYRPGQTIYFTGIVTEKTGDQSVLKTNYATKVALMDANWQKVSEAGFTTDDFGSFHGSFVAPVGVLAGQMTLQGESGTLAITVEEYRRPTFDVEIQPVTGTYRLNETISVPGKATAYAGNPVSGAQVSYRVVRTARYPVYDYYRYIPFPPSPEVEILSGATTTGADGSFRVEFTALPDPALPPAGKPVFNFRVYADVTDLNGETQSAIESISVGYISMVIETDLPARIDLQKGGTWKLKTRNLNGQPAPAAVSVTLSLLKQPDRVFIPRMWASADTFLMSREEFHSLFPYDVYNEEDNPEKWAVDKTCLTREANTGTDTLLDLFHPSSILPGPGTYRMTVRTKDPYGQEVEVVKYFTAFDPSAKEMPVRVMDWFVPLKTTAEPGDTASFLMGTSEDNVHIMYELRQKDQLISRKWITLSDRQSRIHIPILESYRGNIAVTFLFIRSNRVFSNQATVTVPYTNKKLDIRFETFRDKLLPGQEETWKIHINSPDGKGIPARMLASMYDQSLDVFAPNNWYFDIYQGFYYGGTPWQGGSDFRTSAGSWSVPWGKPASFFYPQYDDINWFGMSIPWGGYRTRFVGGMKAAGNLSRTEIPMAATADNAVLREKDVSIPDTAAGGQKPGESAGGATAKPIIRKDFRETAFFYPALMSDSAGNLVISFTVPEALTRWKFLGLAYTKKLEYNTIEKECVTSKDLMVFPNPPRFIRLGDSLVFPVKIVNLADKDMAGEATLALNNALTLNSVNDLLGNNTGSRPFLLKKGESGMVSWVVRVPADADLSVLQYRVTAVSGSVSDGEEKAIPVLPNRMMVTESLPLPVSGKGTFNFSFDRLTRSFSSQYKSNTVNNYRLTLEFASNPAWYAIQALPALDRKTYKSADQVFAAYYSNQVAAFIANSDPKIRSVFDSWKSLTPDALLSNLEKNQELKISLLQQTPWVIEARTESEQKQRLGEFFDLNNLKNNLEENLSLLKKLQTAGGGWCWFEGMPESRYMTQEIVLGFGRLYHLGVNNIRDDASTWNMVLNAVRYLDGMIVKDYEDIRKNSAGKLSENHLSSAVVQYLYARSFFPEMKIEDGSVREAWDYFNGQAEKYWLSQDLFLQGMIALASQRNGNTTLPNAILKSLSEKALHSPEMGMYWAREAGFNWYQAPVEMQALMIEAFSEITTDYRPVEEMKVWLLKQKQTQMWKTTPATVDACYALLLRGTRLLGQDPGVKVNIGGKSIVPSKLEGNTAEAGTGYFKVSWSGAEITADMGKVSVTKSTDGIAWGSLYWQYFENLDKIEAHASPLKIDKKLFLEVNSTSGPVLKEIGDGEIVRVGDKIKVRLVLSVDRNLEFVQMKDMRAAGFEPVPSGDNAYPKWGSDNGLSGYRYQGGLGYYQSTGDVSTSFFFDFLPKGTYVLEYSLVVNGAGDYSNGIAEVQCLYAPEFGAHSNGIRIVVN